MNLESVLKTANPSHRLKLARQKINAAEKHLNAMSYRSVLQRGFTVTRDINGSIIRSTKNIKTHDIIETEFTDGKTRSVVQDTKPTGEKPKKKNRTTSGDTQNPFLFD